MPSPNAFADFTCAGSLVRESAGPAKTIPEKDLTLSQKRVVVAQNQEALRIFRQGLDYPYMAPVKRSFTATFPYFAGYRSLARVLRMEAQVKAADGDYAGAAQSDLDAIQLGEMTPRGSMIIGKLVGVACASIGMKDLWAVVPRLTAEQARDAAARLQRIEANRVSWASTLQGEEWFGQASLLEVLRSPNWRHDMAVAFSMNYEPDSSFNWDVWRGLQLCSRREVLDHYISYMDESIAAARLPYSVTRPAPRVPNDPVSENMLPVLSSAGFRDAIEETESSLLMTALALRTYRLEHGAYPDGLEQLTPGLLQRVPVDPFGNGRAIRYRRTGATYVLYSVGPDAKDDGGVLSTNPKATEYALRRIQLQSRGDIVAGIDVP